MPQLLPRLFWLCVVIASLLGIDESSRVSAQATNSSKLPAAVSRGDAKTIQNIPYAGTESNRQSLDLYLPASPGKYPLVVWIHGGAWKSGSKDYCPYTYLVPDGFAVASLNYRYSTDALFPAQIHDCKGAIRFLRANAAKYGYDAQHIGVAGGSAGGHLAALLGTSGDVAELEGTVGGNLDQSSRVQAVLSVFGPTILYATRPEDQAKFDLPGNPLWILFGGRPSEQQALAQQASPLFHATKDDAPVLMLHGTRDLVVELGHSEKLRDAYDQLQVANRLIVMEGAGHGGPQFSDATARQAIREFFAQHLKPAK